MGEEYTEKMLNQTLNNPYKKHIHTLAISPAKRETMLKEVLEVKITLEYPPCRSLSSSTLRRADRGPGTRQPTTELQNPVQ